MTEQESKPPATAMTNHIIANLGVLWTKLHQFHWYVKGPQFFALHEKFEDLYTQVASWYDELAETQLAHGARPVSTLARNLKLSFLSEDEGDRELSAEEMVEIITDDFESTKEVALRAISLAVEQEMPVLEDKLIEFHDFLGKELYVLYAFLGKEVTKGE